MKKEKILSALLTFLAIYLFLFVIFGKNGLLELSAFEKKKKEMTEKNSEIMAENNHFERIINRLKNDPVFIEDTARQELGVVGKKEIVFKFFDKKGDCR